MFLTALGVRSKMRPVLAKIDVIGCYVPKYSVLLEWIPSTDGISSFSVSFVVGAVVSFFFLMALLSFAFVVATAVVRCANVHRFWTF